MPIAYKPTEAVIALWDDVLLEMEGKPYRVCRLCGIDEKAVSRAKYNGYYPESQARRIHEATLGRLNLTPRSKMAELGLGYSKKAKRVKAKCMKAIDE